MVYGSNHVVMRQMWAKAMLVADPGNARDWQHGVPADVLAASLSHLLDDARSLAAARAVCASWRTAVDSQIRELNLRCAFCGLDGQIHDLHGLVATSRAAYSAAALFQPITTSRQTPFRHTGAGPPSHKQWLGLDL